MLVAINRNNETVYAHQAIITEEYRCPYCKEKLLLKKGLKRFHILLMFLKLKEDV